MAKGMSVFSKPPCPKLHESLQALGLLPPPVPWRAAVSALSIKINQDGHTYRRFAHLCETDNSSLSFDLLSRFGPLRWFSHGCTCGDLSIQMFSTRPESRGSDQLLMGHYSWRQHFPCPMPSERETMLSSHF